ncbi:MAG: hypothetical protein PHR68_05580 [Candidatus Gracilibacteria bacterium]|nr:hypothetical protein [Candidatus Gracilibacteria bacterium]
MQNIEINYDSKTGYYDALVLSKGIATQGKTIDEILKNLTEAFSLSRNKKIILNKFNISFEENYVNI